MTESNYKEITRDTSCIDFPINTATDLKIRKIDEGFIIDNNRISIFLPNNEAVGLAEFILNHTEE